MANEIKVNITDKGSAKKYAAALKKADRASKRFRLTTTGLTRAIGALRNQMLLVTFVTAGVIAAVVKLTKVAGDAQETISKFEVVFKRQASAARAFAEELAVSTNRATIELLDFLATLQDTFVPLGFARDAASELSQKVVQLAVDVASFSNKVDADVIRDFTSALVGNTETVRKYAISISQARLGQELLNAGLATSVKRATEAQKAQARFNLILSGSKDAIGDAARTIESFNNVVVGARSATLALTTVMGDKLIPAAGFVTRIYIAMAKELTRLLTPTDEIVKAKKRLAEIDSQIFRIENLRFANLFAFRLPGLKEERTALLAKIAASEKDTEVIEEETEVLVDFTAAMENAIRRTWELTEAETAHAKALAETVEKRNEARDFMRQFGSAIGDIGDQITLKEINNIDFRERSARESANRTRASRIKHAEATITDEEKLADRLVKIQADFLTDIAAVQERADKDRAAARKSLKPFLIAETIAHGAAGAIKAYFDPGGTTGAILAVAIGIATAAAVATIAAQQFAAGGFSSGRTALVGEQGPELIKPPAGSQVFTNAQSRQMAGPQTIILEISGEAVGSAIIPAIERGSELGANRIALT